MLDNFLGRGLKFPLALNEDNEFTLVSDDEDIQEAIRIILMTSPGERMMRPEFGCGIQNYSFSVINTQNLLQIENEVKRSLVLYEPRVVIEGVDAQVQDSSDGLIYISIDYVLKASNGRHNMVYPFYLQERG